MPQIDSDTAVAARSIEMLCLSMNKTLDERRNSRSQGTQDGLTRLWEQLEAQALEWLARIPGTKALPATVFASGSERILTAIPDETPQKASLQHSCILPLIRETSPDYLRLAVHKGLDAGALMLPIANGISGSLDSQPRDLGQTQAFRDLLLEFCDTHLAITQNQTIAWTTIASYQRNRELKIEMLKRQVRSFPEGLANIAREMSSDSRKCAPLVILSLAGVEMRNLTPPPPDSVSLQRMQTLCAKLSSAHGRMEIHELFGPLDQALNHLQSRLDSYLHAALKPKS